MYHMNSTVPEQDGEEIEGPDGAAHSMTVYHPASSPPCLLLDT